MSDQFGSRFGTPNPEPDDLETILARVMRDEADRVMPAGDGLAKIRARTSARRSAFGWFSSPSARPALAAGTLVLTLVAGTAIGLQLTGGDSDNVVEGDRDPITTLATVAPLIKNSQAEVERYNPDPGAPIGAEGGDQPEPTEDVTEAPVDTLRFAPVTPEQEANKSDNGIPVDPGPGSNYVAIQGPLSGRSYNSPLTIAGVARVFEAQVTIDVSQNGKVLKRTHATATQGAPELGDWQVTIELVPGNYRIDAYALSPKDGETKLASDSIWITIKSPNSATQPTPTPSPTSSPTPSPGSSPAATPTASARPTSDVSTQEAGTEPQ